MIPLDHGVNARGILLSIIARRLAPHKPIATSVDETNLLLQVQYSTVTYYVDTIP